MKPRNLGITEDVPAMKAGFPQSESSKTYDPFVRGRFPVGVRTLELFDDHRGRRFPCEIWYPAAADFASQDLAPDSRDHFKVPSVDSPRNQLAVRDAAGWPDTFPLIAFSHGSARGARRMATFVCTHLSSHGYVVAALDHSEIIAPVMPRNGETKEEKLARAQAVIANRVPDMLFLIRSVVNGTGWKWASLVDPERVGLVGYSLGGWTVLATGEVEPLIQAVVAIAPAGSSKPKPGIAPVKLNFEWSRDIPTLYLAAQDDVMTPLSGVAELFTRTPATKQMVVLRNADHAHFLDEGAQEHEMARSMAWPGDLAWIPKEMRPITELCPVEHAHLLVRGLTVSHMDAILKQRDDAKKFLADEIETQLAARGIDAYAYEPQAGKHA